MLSVAQQKELSDKLTASKLKTLQNIADSNAEIAKASSHIVKTNEHLGEVAAAIDEGRLISTNINNSTKLSYLDMATSALSWVIATPGNAALTIGGGVGIATAFWAYNKYAGGSAGGASNSTLSAPTTTNITINNITKGMEDI